MARYVIGIDLGTTNCAVAYSDNEADDGTISLLEIDQVVAPGEVGTNTSLPSFLLMPSEHEMAAGSMALPKNERRDSCHRFRCSVMNPSNPDTNPGRSAVSAIRQSYPRI